VAYIFAAALVLTIMRYQYQRFFAGIGRRLKLKDPVKYSESTWKLFFYFTSTMWGLYILWVYDFEWVTNTRSLWVNIVPETVGNSTTPDFIVVYYLFELAFYVHSMYAHIVIETRRSDFWEMLAHHFITFLLIGFSYTTYCYRVGIVILVLHDTSDVIFESGKILSYLEREFSGDVVFCLWVASWFLLRLYLFPFHVIRSCWFESFEALGQFPFHQLFSLMLSGLVVLHVFWTFMIFNFIWRKFFIKEISFEDPREIDEKKKKKRS